MHFHLDYHLKDKFTALSEKIKSLSSKDNIYREYVNVGIKAENLQFNLSYVLSHIILNLNYIDRSKKKFEKILFDFNNRNNSTISIKDLEEISWIRIVTGEVILPQVVRYLIWKVGYDKQEGKKPDIPAGKEKLVEFLSIYYQRCFYDSKLKISKNELSEILSLYAPAKVTIEFLTQQEILTKIKDKEEYVWIDRNYIKTLKNEIAATLWMLICNENSFEEFKEYIALLLRMRMYGIDLTYLLTPEQCSEVGKFALKYLLQEDDLLKSSHDFQKIWMDAADYRSIEINDPVPIVHFDYSNPYNFIESIKSIGRQYEDLFYYQKSRVFCSLLLGLHLKSCSGILPDFSEVSKILKDLSRPFLLLILYNDIPTKFSSIIPFLLNDTELIPIILRSIDKISINEAYLKIHENWQLQNAEKYKLNNELFFESFDLILDLFSNSQHDNLSKGNCIIKILLDTSKNVFHYNPNDNYVSHNNARKRYEKILKSLILKRHSRSNNAYNISPRIIISLLPEMLDYLLNEYQTHKEHSNYLSLDLPFLDVSTEVLRMCNLYFFDGEIYAPEKKLINEKALALTDNLFKYLLDYYSQDEVEVIDFFGKTKETKKIRRYNNQFGFEIIDWSYLFLLFEKSGYLYRLKKEFCKTLVFDINQSIYDEQNKEQSNKLKSFVKSMLLAFNVIHTKNNELEIEQLPVKRTLTKLENYIQELSTEYSLDKFEDERVNIFDENFYVYGQKLYYQSLRSLLFHSLNYFANNKAVEFIKDFFEQSIDMGSMLTAINILESKELAKTVADRIRTIEIEEYIKSRYTVTDLQDTLIEAVNSESHWDLAESLIQRIQKHLQKVGKDDENMIFMLFNVNLLLAFKENNSDKLAKIEIPKPKYIISYNDRGEHLKSFFTGLQKLYNEKDYEQAIKIFQSLRSKEDEPRYAFHLYRAQTLKAIHVDDLNLLGMAFQQWEEFSKSLKEENKKKISELTEAIASNQLHYYAHVDDRIKFNNNLSMLSRPYLYEEEIIPTVYNYYTSMELYDAAFSYLKNSIEYLKLNGKQIPAIIGELQKNSVTKELLLSFKNSLINIRSIAAKDLPSITPDIVNDKRNLSDFIFNELVQAAKVMTVKRDAIKKNPHEDRFNDLFLATLKLRFQIWGWSIHDQPRTGISPTSINAGEADITIQAGGIDVALLEGMILKGKEKAIVEKHVQKIFGYNNYLERYYMIIYFKGKQQNFNNTWQSYKSDVEQIHYDEKFKINKNSSFTEVSQDYNDVTNLKLAKTYHGENCEIVIFHMMIDLSD
ncbi:hypothetical protein [uncultured Sphingobacterium sp.]|uniref:hypothetical protein n=1 Tax=uncultured Sphingobacterium sp. TaxID=182688 RepID=UPI00374838B9